MAPGPRLNAQITLNGTKRPASGIPTSGAQRSARSRGRENKDKRKGKVYSRPSARPSARPSVCPSLIGDQCERRRILIFSVKRRAPSRILIEEGGVPPSPSSLWASEAPKVPTGSAAMADKY